MLTIKNLKKRFPNANGSKSLFSGLGLSIQKGEKTGLFAPNGYGKSTLFNIIAGIDDAYAGSLTVNADRISYVNQDTCATLLPWYSCKKNILLIRRYYRMDMNKGLDLLNRLVDTLYVNFSLALYPFQLSGGQRQLVALLRALIAEPDFLLMDEPFSALDMEKRAVVKKNLHSVFDEHTTILLSSHRGDEVNTLIDRAVIMASKSPTIMLENINQHDFKTRYAFENYVAKIQFHETPNKDKSVLARDHWDTDPLAGCRMAGAV